MRVLVFGIGYIVVLFTGLQLHAQADTVLQLPEVEVTANLLDHSTPLPSSDTFNDSMLVSSVDRNIGEMLANESTWFVKSYGGGIATTTIRGSNAAQVALTWNGIQIQNQMLGLSDLSLLHPSLFNGLVLERGGNSVLRGNGAVGGSINLTTAPVHRDHSGAGVKVTMGSFGRREAAGNFHFSKGAFSWSARGFYLQSRNNFTYPTAPGAPDRELEHARVLQGGTLQSLSYSFSPHNTITAHVWWQESNRQIPPTTVQNISEAEQYDRSIRSLVEWNFLRNRLATKVQAGYLNDRIHFSDPRSSVDAPSEIRTWVLSATAGYAIAGKLVLHPGIEQYWTMAGTDAYTSSRKQSRTSIHAELTSEIGQAWRLTAGARQEIADGKFTPLALSGSATWQFHPDLEAHVRVSRDYRIPGLNDQWWAPGGNPDLETERSAGGEIRVAGNHDRTGCSIDWSAGAYARNTRNWILWSPTEGKPYWSAQNLAEVLSRGLEMRFGLQKAIHNFTGGVGAGYDLTISTNQIGILIPDLPKGSQLIYTPRHKGLLTAEMDYAGLQITYSQSFTGEVGTEFNTVLPGYSIANLRAQYTVGINGNSLAFGAAVDNLWDKDYMVLEYRPMPGRNFNFFVKFNFQ